MSETTTSAKKSFLTVAMENVRAKQNNENSDETTPASFKAEITRFRKIAVLAAVGTTAVLAAAWAINNARTEDETTDEVENSEI